MPQMSPMWWLTLSVVFNLLIIMIMCNLYFNYTIELNQKKKKKKKKEKW
nr:ATP synthase F0 subunit 8 [Centrotus cornutus]WBV77357.1 ATP synthase F0 subunit 8 [Centrotus cornutus]